MAKPWTVAGAKAQFSRLLKSAQKAPQVIATRGVETAVVLSIEDYESLKESAQAHAPATRLRAFFDASARLRAAGGWDFTAERETRPSPFEDE